MGSCSPRDINVYKEIRLVFDTNVFVPAIAKSLNPALKGYEDKHKAYNTFLAKGHYLIISGDIVKEYGKVIAEAPFNFSPSIIQVWRLGELSETGKIRDADKKLRKRIEVKVKVPEDDLPFLKAAIALDAKYIVSQDNRHFLRKADEIFREHGITVLDPKTYVEEN